MKIFVIFLLGIHMTCAATHTLQYFYTATSGIPNFPEFISLGMLDGKQTDYYDSNIKKAIPKLDWMSTDEGPEYWNRQTQACVGAEQSFKNNIKVAMSRFNQSGGVHTVQIMYGCKWDDETGATNGFEQHGFDGEDFLTLHLKELRWVSPVQQGLLTTQKWNDNKAKMESDKQYYENQCLEWLKKYLQYGKSSLEKTVSPQVSVLQKSSSSPVTCHATGFYPSGVTITWQKNGQEHHEDVDLGELLPNEDGTFQRTSTLRVTPDERKKNEFSCVVEHQGKTVREILPDDSFPIGIIVGVVVAVLLVVSGVVGFVVYRKKKGFKPVPQDQSDDGSNKS